MGLLSNLPLWGTSRIDMMIQLHYVTVSLCWVTLHCITWHFIALYCFGLHCIAYDMTWHDMTCHISCIYVYLIISMYVQCTPFVFKTPRHREACGQLAGARSTTGRWSRRRSAEESLLGGSPGVGMDETLFLVHFLWWINWTIGIPNIWYGLVATGTCFIFPYIWML